MKKFYRLNRQIVTIIVIICLAAFFRLYGLNWDQNQHLHPDERFLTMVAGAISWPRTATEYLDTQQSPLNPANADFSFFVYGTFPLFFTKAIATLSALDDYTNFTLLGRALSALFDIGTVILVYLITKGLTASRSKGKNQIFPLLSAFFYSIAVLPIQLSHFFAVDTFLTFFITLSFYLLMKLASFATNYDNIDKLKTQSSKSKTVLNLRFRNWSLFGFWILDFGFYAIPLGIAFGLALASKVSALLFLPIILLGLLISKLFTHVRGFFRQSSQLLTSIFIFCIFTYLTFRLANPYAFSNSNLLDPTPNLQFVQNLKTLKSFNNPDAYYPPAVQWIKTKPFVFPLRNIIYYGLGLPLSILAIGGFIYALVCLATHFKAQIIKLVKKRKTQNKRYKRQAIAYQLYPLLLIILWTGGLFFYQGAQFVKALRYFASIYPFLAIFAALFAATFSKKLLNKSKIYLLPVTCYLLLVLIWPIAFISIYSRPHSRVTASRWIYENIPPGATLTCEHWDDCLPLPGIKSHALNNKNNKKAWLLKAAGDPSDYNVLQLPLYDPDTPEKWRSINEKLAEADYIILSSNRLYGSIASVPERYPRTSKFYRDLFAGKTQFTKIAEFTSRPHLSFPFSLRTSHFSPRSFCLTPPFEWYGDLARPHQECNTSGLTIVDDYADESFTVYDHPKVIIFQKQVRPLSHRTNAAVHHRRRTSGSVSWVF